MSIKNILLFTVLISLGIHDLIQAEVIRGLDIPRVNVSRIVGKWYRLTTDTEEKRGSLACSTSVIEQLSDDSYRINLTRTFTPEAKKNNPNIPDEPVEFVITATLLNDSSIIVGSTSDGHAGSTVIFDIDYDSHMAVYATNTIEEVANGANGVIMIVGRQKTLPDGILERVKQSNFYKQGVKPNYELFGYDTTSCQ